MAGSRADVDAPLLWKITHKGTLLFPRVGAVWPLVAPDPLLAPAHETLSARQTLTTTRGRRLHSGIVCEETLFSDLT